MTIEQRIGTVLRALPAQRITVALALQSLTENLPGVAFPEVAVTRDDEGAIVGLNVTYMDEIHDPTVRSVVVDLPG